MKLNWNYPTNIWVGEHRVDDLHEPTTLKPETGYIKKWYLKSGKEKYYEVGSCSLFYDC